MHFLFCLSPFSISLKYLRARCLIKMTPQKLLERESEAGGGLNGLSPGVPPTPTKTLFFGRQSDTRVLQKSPSSSSGVDDGNGNGTWNTRKARKMAMRKIKIRPIIMSYVSKGRTNSEGSLCTKLECIGAISWISI